MPTFRRTSSSSRRSTTTSARRTRSSIAGRSTVSRSSNRSSSWKSSQFSTLRTNIQGRIGSYRNIFSQVKGPGQITAFSPTTANKLASFVNNGAFVYKFSNAQFSKAFGKKWGEFNTSNAAATKFFRTKFGQGIKQVTKGSGNNWLVVAGSQLNKGPFRNYTWK